LAGDGELRPAIEDLARELGVAGRVIFLGRRGDMPETLAAADVFALASRWEGNPLSVMEAMAAGLPVVATTAGAVPELVRHGVDGMLSSPGDAAALARSMRATFEMTETTRRAMGNSAAQRARDRFGLAAMASAYADLYRQTISRAPQNSQAQEQLFARTTW
jgi:glycosyltransferase involved in cell wall biosynthesis